MERRNAAEAVLGRPKFGFDNSAKALSSDNKVVENKKALTRVEIINVFFLFLSFASSSSSSTFSFCCIVDDGIVFADDDDDDEDDDDARCSCSLKERMNLNNTFFFVLVFDRSEDRKKVEFLHACCRG